MGDALYIPVLAWWIDHYLSLEKNTNLSTLCAIKPLKPGLWEARAVKDDWDKKSPEMKIHYWLKTLPIVMSKFWRANKILDFQNNLSTKRGLSILWEKSISFCLDSTLSLKLPLTYLWLSWYCLKCADVPSAEIYNQNNVWLWTSPLFL